MFDKTSIKIMLLDDEPFMLKLLARQLEHLGFATPMAHTGGYAALGTMTTPCEMPDLILLDLNMPEMDGIEFVRQLAQRHYPGSLILISGEDERMLQSASTLVRAHKIGLLGHLHKPVANEELTALLATWTAPRVAQARGVKTVYDAETLRRAIAQGELVNYYQPKVCVADGRVVGVETLVRWRHPVDGIVYPDQFIALAEANDLIDDLTRAVLCQAMAQARLWCDAGLNLRVAVNLSMDNLAKLEFADYVAQQAALAGVAPSSIVLEVTESRLMADVRAPLDILTRLRLKRFRLSIDDFGTGNSSLTQLRDIPFDELKIDQGFVHGAASNETRRGIFNGSLHLARQLGMEVVAEGVEDQTDWDFLRLSDCDLAQGYFIARPMPAAELGGWMSRWESERRVAMTGGVSA